MLRFVAFLGLLNFMVSNDLTSLSLAAARDGLAAKKFSATELTQAFIIAIDKANPQLNAYVLPTPEHALAQAKASDARIAQGQFQHSRRLQADL